jgi:single-stranded-DNA-specific exonuclease
MAPASQSWAEPALVSVPTDLSAAVGGHPLVATLLARRGILTSRAARAFLDPGFYTPRPPTDLPGMDAAVRRILAAIEAGEPIGVWGDFDVDGVTAATVLQESLLAAGALVKWVHIPGREAEGHGVHQPTLEAISSAASGGQGVRLVITCDTGITSSETLTWAAGQGLDVIVTDHHLPESHLPPAAAIVTPRFLPPEHPLAGLPGVGVAYLVGRAVMEARGVGDASDSLDLVALGIVADVAPQRDDVRYLLQRGLVVLRANRRVGLQALLESARVDADSLNEETIGFALAPRINALGRLAHAQAAVDLFTTLDLARARALAAQMESLNAQRQLLCSQVTAGALAQLERDPALLDEPVLVLGHATWPAGVVGIVAARLVERFGRPAIVLTTPLGEPAHGSARSVAGVDICAAIAAHRELLDSFGGHPMAAGLSLRADRLPEFRRALSRTVGEMVARAPVPPGIQVDAYLGWDEPSLRLADDLVRLAPFGAGNPSPCFVSRDLHVASATDLGRTGEHRRAMVADEHGMERPVIWWHGADTPVPDGPIDLAYSLRTRLYRGQTQLQVEWLDSRSSRPALVTVAAAAVRTVDLRDAPRPLEALLAALQAAPGRLPEARVWAEVNPPSGLPAEVLSMDRRNLAAAAALVVWTTPPGAREWAAALARVHPSTVYLSAQDPGVDTLASFLPRLAGLVKHALRAKGGRAEYADLAAAMASREESVRLGLLWLAAAGHVRIADEDVTGLWLAKVEPVAAEGPPPLLPGEDLRLVRRRLADLLAETAAYRRYFRQAKVVPMT